MAIRFNSKLSVKMVIRTICQYDLQFCVQKIKISCHLRSFVNSGFRLKVSISFPLPKLAFAPFTGIFNCINAIV